MNIAPLNKQVVTLKPQSSPRFGEIYKIIGKSPAEIEEISKMLHEKAGRQNLDIVIANPNNQENETLVFTKDPGDLAIGRFFKSFPANHALYLKNLKLLCLNYKKIWKNFLIEKENLIFEILKDKGINVEDPNFKKEFRLQFEIFEKVGPINTILVSSVKTLLPYKPSSKSELDFMTDINDAFSGLNKWKQTLRSAIRTQISNFKLNTDKKIDFYVYESALKWIISPQAPLQTSEVKKWLEDGSMDIFNGKRKHWSKRIFSIFKKQ